MLSLTFVRAPSKQLSLQCRHFRMKPFPGRVAAARDERYLRILEQKFEAAKTRRDAEESSNSQDYAAWRSKAKKAEKEAEQFAFDDENALFWDTALSDTQKALLKTFNVKTFQELVSASNEAETVMSEPPHPTLQQLKPRLRHAYNIYQSVMQSTTQETFVPSDRR